MSQPRKSLLPAASLALAALIVVAVLHPVPPAPAVPSSNLAEAPRSLESAVPSRAENLTIPGGDPVRVGPWAEAPEPAAAHAQTARAMVTVNGHSFNLVPNAAGHFQRVYVSPFARLQVHVKYSNSTKSEHVEAQILDAGTIGGCTARLIPFLGERTAEFDIELTGTYGAHRVVLKKGDDLKVLDFWVGAPLPANQER